MPKGLTQLMQFDAGPQFVEVMPEQSVSNEIVAGIRKVKAR